MNNRKQCSLLSCLCSMSQVSVSDGGKYVKYKLPPSQRRGVRPTLNLTSLPLRDRQCNTAALSNIPIEIFVICDVSVLNYLEFYNIPDSN